MKHIPVKYKWNEKELYRQLHVEGDSFADRNARKLIAQLKNTVMEEMELQAGYVEGAPELKTGIPELDQCEKKIICLVYASEKVTKLLSEMMRKEELLEAYLFDAITTTMLFQAEDQLDKYVANTFRKQGLCFIQKYFPGESGIPLQLQKLFLSVIKQGENLAVQVNKSGMLIPEKAMLYAVGLDRKGSGRSWKHSCNQCSRKDCIFRKEI